MTPPAVPWCPPGLLEADAAPEAEDGMSTRRESDLQEADRV